MRQTILWICILVINLGRAQDLPSTLQLAGEHLVMGNIEEANTLYRRVMFFDTANVYENQVIEGLAFSSFQLGDFDEASGYFLALNQLSDQSEYYFLHILSLLKQDKYMQAKRAVFSIPDTSDQVVITKKVFLGLSEYGLRSFDAAQKYLQEANDLVGNQVDDTEVFRETQHVEKKNKMLAIFFSAVVPGLGQAYSGHIREGANSLLLMSIFGAVYLYTVRTLGPVDALVSILPWFHRYYVGGLNSAVDLVDHYKTEHFDLLYNDLVRIYGPMIR